MRLLGGEQGSGQFRAIALLWALLLCRHSGREEVVLGVPHFGRGADARLADIVGYFVTMLPLRLDLPRGRSWGALSEHVGSAVQAAMQNTDVPFAAIVDRCLPNLPRDPSRNSVFQTIFSWNDLQVGAASYTMGERVEAEDITLCSRQAKVDLSLIAQPSADGSVHCTLNFNTALFDLSTAERIVGRLVTLAEAVVSEPGVDAWASSLATKFND